VAYRKTIGFIGGGNMAEALAGGIIKAGICEPLKIIISEPAAHRRDYLSRTYGVRVTPDNTVPVKVSGTIFLATKPQVLPEVLEEIKDLPAPKQLIISIAAGITLSYLEGLLPRSPMIRSMPNTPALIGCGATVVAPGAKVSAEMTRWAVEIFHSVGTCLVLPGSLMDAVTGLSGSGPAYVFRMAESLIEAGAGAGLPEEAAVELVKQTILGAARMMIETDKEPGELREMVTSPAGTTEAGLRAMAAAGFEKAVKEGVNAAVERSKELGKR
jgi:pyrroline-5-carboxylate reductase